MNSKPFFAVFIRIRIFEKGFWRDLSLICLSQRLVIPRLLSKEKRNGSEKNVPESYRT